MYSNSSIIELMSRVMGSEFARTEHIFFLLESLSAHVERAVITVSRIVFAGAVCFLLHFETRTETAWHAFADNRLAWRISHVTSLASTPSNGIRFDNPSANVSSFSVFPWD